MDVKIRLLDYAIDPKDPGGEAAIDEGEAQATGYTYPGESMTGEEEDEAEAEAAKEAMIFGMIALIVAIAGIIIFILWWKSNKSKKEAAKNAD
ncbi:hypothetical protein ES703_86198 [subsurface metagenome]